MVDGGNHRNTVEDKQVLNKMVIMENDLKIFVKKYFEKEGYWIYKKEKFRIDVLAIRSKDDIVAIELKGTEGDVRKGVGQALSYLRYAHRAYIAVDEKLLSVAREITRFTPIGILAIESGKPHHVWADKEPQKTIPNEEKMIELLNSTVGMCWICGRTFNIIPQAGEAQSGNYPRDYMIYAAFRGDDPKLHDLVKLATGQKRIRTAGIWVGICVLCSTILGHAISEFLIAVKKGGKSLGFTFDELELKEVKELFESQN